MQEYTYTNDLGRKKTIHILDSDGATEINEDGQKEYPYMIFDVATGDSCQSGKATLKDLADFLDYYGVDISGLLLERTEETRE